jgi:hypothetical protein
MWERNDAGFIRFRFRRLLPVEENERQPSDLLYQAHVAFFWLAISDFGYNSKLIFIV